MLHAVPTHQYTKGSLSEFDVDADPAVQFKCWFEEARVAGIPLAEAVSLATAELPSGRVSCRIVLLKELNSEGQFVVYSNWEHSRKAHDVASNPFVALTFWHKELERQIRIEGRAERMTEAESQAYYSSRPRGSQLGAWASHQSQPVESREELEHEVEDVSERFKDLPDDKIPIPPFWGGLKVTPETYEFWQGRPSRIHDRIQYVRDESGAWNRRRLSP